MQRRTQGVPAPRGLPVPLFDAQLALPISAWPLPMEPAQKAELKVLDMTCPS